MNPAITRMEQDKGIYLDWNRIKGQSRRNPAITRMERDKGIYLDWNRIKRQSRMNPAITRMEQDKETLSYTWAINTKKNYVRKSVSPSRSQGFWLEPEPEPI